MVMAAIGLPGGPARIVEAMDISAIATKVQPGEVAVEVERFAPGRISADGLGFVEHVPDLAERKAERRNDAKRERSRRIGQGLDVPGIGLVQTNRGPGRDSIAAIERLAARAARRPDDLIRFTLADNAVVELSAAQMLDLADVVAAHEQACRDAAEAIFTAIDTAEDEATLNAIDITAGYPAQTE